jgi:hypothetical protein
VSDEAIPIRSFASLPIAIEVLAEKSGQNGLVFKCWKRCQVERHEDLVRVLDSPGALNQISELGHYSHQSQNRNIERINPRICRGCSQLYLQTEVQISD